MRSRNRKAVAGQGEPHLWENRSSGAAAIFLHSGIRPFGFMGLAEAGIQRGPASLTGPLGPPGHLVIFFRLLCASSLFSLPCGQAGTQLEAEVLTQPGERRPPTLGQSSLFPARDAISVTGRKCSFWSKKPMFTEQQQRYVPANKAACYT